MALESGTYIDDLIASNPPQSDSLTQAAGHIRLIKSCILSTFPNITGAVTATHTELNATIAAVAAAQFVPAGSIQAFAGSSLPTGYLWCNGASVLRADYAGLFTAIGTTWGTVDGTHFTLPNFKDRFLVGKADMGGTADAAIIDSLLTSTTLGSTYDGEGAIDTITLTTTELPAHTHSVPALSYSGTSSTESALHTHTVSGNTSTDGAHTHTYSDKHRGGTTTRDSSGGTSVNKDEDDDGRTTGSSGSHFHSWSGTSATQSAFHTHTFSGSTGTGTTGSGGTGAAWTVAILPPSAVVNWIIKT